MSRSRQSGGGRVVLDSLESIGYDTADPRHALWETATPGLRPYRSVLAQNAGRLWSRRPFAR